MKKLILVLSVMTAGCNSPHMPFLGECNYKMPVDLHLLYSAKQDKYVIAVDLSFEENQYLDLNSLTGFIGHNNLVFAELFNDSCKAKAFAHRAVKQNDPKKDFKLTK